MPSLWSAGNRGKLISRIGGVGFVLLGLVVNAWTLALFVAPSGFIGSSRTRLAIAAAQLVSISAGIWLVLKAPRATVPSATNWMVLVASTLFSFGVTEMALRSFFQPERAMSDLAYVGQFENRPSKNFEIDTNTGWRMRKSREFQWRIDDHLNSYRSNGQGFRSHRDFDHLPKRLIAIAGDSFTWGTGVDYGETFGDLLEAQVAGAEIFNFAMPGFGLDQMWMSVRHQMLPLKPNLIIVAFIDEDLERSLTAYRTGEGFNKPRFVSDIFGNLRRQTAADTPNLLVQYFQSNSRLWKIFSKNLSRLRPFSEWWALNTGILEAIASDCKSQQVPMLFIRLPQKNPQRFTSLDRFMESKGFDFLELGTPGIPHGIHFENDGHINAKGHEFVAGKISEWLRKRLPKIMSAPENRPL